MQIRIDGRGGQGVVSAAEMLAIGGFAAMTGALKLESVMAAVRSKFPGRVGESNVAAAETAYELVAHRDTLEEVDV